MFFFVFGKDTERSHKKFEELVASFLKKNEGGEFFYQDEDSFSESYFNDVLKTKSLFGDKKIFSGKRILQNSTGNDSLMSSLDRMNVSEDFFLFWEDLIKEKNLKKIKKYPGSFQEFGAQTQKEKKDNFLFLFSDTLASKKKEKTWLLFREALSRGFKPEDLFWKMFWQTKNLLLVKNGGGKSLHPFVYGKTKSAVSLFSREELLGYSRSLVDIYHKSRRGEGDLALSLEKLILRS